MECIQHLANRRYAEPVFDQFLSFPIQGQTARVRVKIRHIAPSHLHDLAVDHPVGYGIAAWSPNVTTITVDAANPTYESRNNAIVEKSTNKLIQGCKTTEIPESVTEIFAASFTGMGIEEFVIPKTISKIGNYIFTFNDNLEKVISYIEEPFDVSEEAFCYSKEENEEPLFTSATLYVPVGTLQKYQAAKGWNKFSNIVEMESTGINAINTVDASDAEWFSIDGKRLNAPQKGLNIIREKGKVTRKIIIK